MNIIDGELYFRKIICVPFVSIFEQFIYKIM